MAQLLVSIDHRCAEAGVMELKVMDNILLLLRF